MKEEIIRWIRPQNYSCLTLLFQRLQYILKVDTRPRVDRQAYRGRMLAF